ncbi:P-loop containing nucleoside triphosphate hydrolase protein [Lizonia empirigonia]|nr:P-loop containing nucleoside triphosphate hydrolase protein [Lizonia empirigonia]
MEAPTASSTDLIVAAPVQLANDNLQIWPEPVDTPGILPRHLIRQASSRVPLLEIIHRLLYRLRPDTHSDLDKILAVVALYSAAIPVYNYLKDFAIWAFTVQITIPEHDPAAKDVLAWMSAEVIQNRRSRSAMIVTDGSQQDEMNQGRRLMIGPSGRVGSRNMQGTVDNEVSCLPPIGSRIFWVGFRPFLFDRVGGTKPLPGLGNGNSIDTSGRLQNALTITTLGWNLEPLQNFVGKCHTWKKANMTGTTTVYFAGGGGQYDYGGGQWQSISKPVRKLDTIDMEERVKLDLVRDAEYYYSEQSKQFFADCGIPYRRGYLFYGPPGTGKTSFSAALAGQLNCDIYHINLASGDITDGKLHQLFLGLPQKCVVVIEDIDSAGIGREVQAELKQAAADLDLAGSLMGAQWSGGPKSLAGSKGRSLVTLSGLLNAIDGNASQEGRLLILTSNNPDALDAALTRPGRIDKKVYFGNMSKSAGKSIFMRLIGRSALAHDAVFSMAYIEQCAAEFAEKVPAHTFTPAQVQNFLQGCRGNPVKALSEIDAWVADNRPTAAGTSSSPVSNATMVEAEEGEVEAL